MKKKIIAIVLMICLCLNLAACGNKEQAKDETKTEEKKLEEVSVVLDWYPNAVHSFIYDAIEKGYYEAEGLKVNIVFPSNTNDAISLPAAGKADVGVYYMQDIIMSKVNENIPVKAIGTIVQKPLSIVLSLKKKGIASPKDLVGKKLGYGGTVLSESIIKSMMENVGADQNSVKTVDVGFDLMSSMTTEKVDATLGCYINHEVPEMQSEGFDVQYFFPSDYGVPGYYELVFVTGDNQLKNSPEKLQKFLRASKKGFEDMKNHPEDVLKILMKNQNAENFPLKEAVEKQSMDILVPVMEQANQAFLTQDPNVWQKNIDWLYEKKIINNKVNASDVMQDVLK